MRFRVCRSPFRENLTKENEIKKKQILYALQDLFRSFVKMNGNAAVQRLICKIVKRREKKQRQTKKQFRYSMIGLHSKPNGFAYVVHTLLRVEMAHIHCVVGAHIIMYIRHTIFMNVCNKLMCLHRVCHNQLQMLFLFRV